LQASSEFLCDVVANRDADEPVVEHTPAEETVIAIDDANSDGEEEEEAEDECLRHTRRLELRWKKLDAVVSKNYATGCVSLDALQAAIEDAQKLQNDVEAARADVDASFDARLLLKELREAVTVTIEELQVGIDALSLDLDDELDVSFNDQSAPPPSSSRPSPARPLFSGPNKLPEAQMHALGMLTLLSWLMSHSYEMQSYSDPTPVDLILPLSRCIPAEWCVDIALPEFSLLRYLERRQQIRRTDPSTIHTAVCEVGQCLPYVALSPIERLLSAFLSVNCFGLLWPFLQCDYACTQDFVYYAWALREHLRRTDKEKRCRGVVFEADVSFVAQHYAHGEVRNGDGTVVGRLVCNENGSPTAVVACNCTGFAATAAAARCLACSACARVIQSARQAVAARHGPGHVRAQLPPEAQESYDQHMRTAQKLQSPHGAGSGDGAVKEAVRLLVHCVKSGVLNFNTFRGQNLLHELQTLENGDLRAVRWTNEQLAYYESVRFTGGSAAITEIRGPIAEGTGNSGGTLPLSCARIRTLAPSISTLKAHLPIAEVYPQLAGDAVELRKALERGGACRVGGISLDAIIVPHGYTYISYLRLLVGRISRAHGASGAIRLKDVAKYDATQLADESATHILQFFWTSLDGKATWPLGYIALRGDSATATFEALQVMVERLHKTGIGTVFTSSDSFRGSDQLVRMLSDWSRAQPGLLPIHHVFDYQHLLKNGRAVILNHGWSPRGTRFSLKTLHSLWKSAQSDARSHPDPEMRRKYERFVVDLTVEDMAPTDKMNWAAVKNLITKAPGHLRTLYSKDPAATGLAEYLEHLHGIYFVFHVADETTLPEARFTLLDSALKYFSLPCASMSTDFVNHLQITITSLRALVAWQQKGDPVWWPQRQVCPRWSYLSTLVVEHFFSIIRSIQPYPSLAQYAVSYYAAYNHLVFCLSTDMLCPQFQARAAFGKVRISFYEIYEIYITRRTAM